MSPIRACLLAALLLAACARTPTGAEPRDDAPPAGPTSRVVLGDAACQTDADCVPASCCHPDRCVSPAEAPDCTDVMCTMECRAGTMDCGGACLCQDGRCAARLMTSF